MENPSNAQNDPTKFITIPLIYYPNECFVCKASIPLKRCSRCNMISYCGKEHQLEHWRDHKEICKVISAVLLEKEISHIFEMCRGFDDERWQDTKKEVAKKIEVKLGRRLSFHERQMFYFPRACFVCHDSRQELLKNCPGCPNASFCDEHPNSSLHDADCADIQTCHQIEIVYYSKTSLKNSDLLTLSSSIVENVPFIKYLPYRKLPTSLKEFMKYAEAPMDLPPIRALYLAELLNLPLTTFSVLQKLDQLSPSELLIHASSANQEYEDGKRWEILFHLMPNLTQLRIIIIGEDETDKLRCKLCYKCRANKKKLFIQTIDDSYVNYASSKDFKEPDLVLLFNQNPPLAENEEYSKIWKLMLMTWGMVNCPLAMLTVSEEKAKLAKESVESTFHEIQIFYDGQNDFATRKPNRLWENERVFRDNDYMLIFKVIHEKELLKCNRCGITARTVDLKTSRCAGCEADLISKDVVLFPEQNNNRFRSIYYVDSCQVCHYRPYSVEDFPFLIPCDSCKVVSYCNQDHQKEHWPEHKDLCKVILDLMTESGSQYLFQNVLERSKNWLDAKISMMLKAESKLGRKLLEHEREIFFFPKACFCCHETDSTILRSCYECGVKLCHNHADSLDHDKYCRYLSATFECDTQLLVVRQSPAPITTMEALLFSTRRKVFRNIPMKFKPENLPRTIEAFIKEYIYMYDQKCWEETHPLHHPNFRQVLYADIFSRPLTVFLVTQALNRSPDSMIVHVIGATDDEKCEGGYWEVLLHLMQSLTNLEVIFIGPEVSELQLVKMSVCEGCSEEGKSLGVRGLALRYDEYFKSESFVKPDIIVGYNLHLHESAYGLTEDTWKDTILTLTKISAPFLMTVKKIEKAFLDNRILEVYLGKTVHFNYLVLNRFRGFSLNRDFLTEKLETLNQFLVVYLDLFGLTIPDSNENSKMKSILTTKDLKPKEAQSNDINLEANDLGMANLKIDVEK